MKKPLFLSLAIASFALFLGLGTAARAQDAKAGDAAAGEKKVQMCIGCHNIPGYQASFPEIYKVPKIAGQNAKYIVSALTAYRKGERAIRPCARSPPACPTRTWPTSPPTTSSSARARARRRPPPPSRRPRSPSCSRRPTAISCHGNNFSKPIDAAYPKLAGQHADYLYAALKAYQTDHNPLVGRSNPIMMGMARPFTHPEIKAIASYLSSLPSELETVTQSRFR